MQTIGETLQQFLEETGRGNSGSTASPTAVIRVFQSYLNGWAHEDLNPFERQRFECEYAANRRFCDIFDAIRIRPHHLNAMLGHHAIRHGPSTKGFLKAVGPVMQKLASWLSERGFWTAEDQRWYRELVGDQPGGDLSACEHFAHVLHEYLERHPVDAPVDLPDEDYYDDQFTIAKVEPEKLHLNALLNRSSQLANWATCVLSCFCRPGHFQSSFPIVGSYLEGEAPIVLALPKSVTAKARAGWSVSFELARVRGTWRILGVGNVYP